jgi:hypothetical protein
VRQRTLILALLTLPLLAACEGPFNVRDCTLIGCRSGLAIELTDIPPGPLTLEVVLSGSQTQTLTCAQHTCPPYFFVPDVRPDEVTLRITTTAGTLTETMRPAWSRSQPNGPGCGPVCWEAKVTMSAVP